ncbi:MAG: FAD-dependent oxidoreductase [Promethearchaeota archaeon]
MIGSVLVIGGGIAGIEASLQLTDLGFKVYLIEKRPSIGGHMAQLEKTFPKLDCSLCILAPKMVGIYQNPNIELYTLSKVKSVKGKAGNFKVKILKKPRYIDEQKCRGCGDCAAKCPKIEYPNQFDMDLGKRKSIYIPFPQATPPTYIIDPKSCLYLTREVCGVCKKICKGDAINFDQEPQEIILNVGAIIIATGFEMLGLELPERWGYKFKNVVNALEYERILCKTGPFGGQVLRLSDEKEPKKIAFIQCAGSLDLDENVPYCSKVCCLYTAKEAILTRQYSENIDTYIFRHKIRAFGKNYYEHAKEAQNEFGIKYIHSKIYKIEENSKNNDLNIKFKDLMSNKDRECIANMVVLSAPLVHSKGTKKLAKILGIELDQYGFYKERSYIEKSLSTKNGIYLCGFCQSPMDISETVIHASSVASQVANFLNPVKYSEIIQEEIDISKAEDIINVIPSALIVGGGVSGMTAALNIANQGFHSYLIEKEGILGGNLNYINIIFPTQEKASDLLDNLQSQVYSNENISVFLDSKILKVEGFIGNFDVSIINNEGNIQEIKVGTIIIATGGKEFKPKGHFQYKAGNNNIITQMELESRFKNKNVKWLQEINNVSIILCANARKKDGFSYCSNVCCSNAIKNIDILENLKPDIQILVFFRDLHMAKKDFEGEFSEERKTVRYIRYDPFNIPEVVKIANEPEKYVIILRDELDPKKFNEYSSDLIILSTPMVPPEDLTNLAKVLDVPIDKHGFFLEAHTKLRPLDFSNNGIFLCGCAQWPKNIQDSIMQANGAAGRAGRFLNLKEISSAKLKFLSFLLSIECHFKDMIVIEEKCNGCGQCVDVCSFKAIKLIDSQKEFEDISLPLKKAMINPAICKGCGKCASTCRLKAIDARHYDFNQISAIMNPYFMGRGKYREREESVFPTT